MQAKLNTVYMVEFLFLIVDYFSSLADAVELDLCYFYL